MVVTTADQSCSCGRAERRRVELSVAQSSFRDPVHCRCRDYATKSVTHTVPLIVCYDEQDIWGTLRWDHPWRPVGLGILGGFIDHATKLRIGWWQLFAANGYGRIRRTRRAVDLLC